MSGTVVTFDYGVWSLRYPELVAEVSPALAQIYFNEATIYHQAPCGANPVTELTILNMLTAHIAQLAIVRTVGRISNASEGSVSVATVFADAPVGTLEWFQQTVYGTSYLAATSRRRLGRYVPPIRYRGYGRGW
jgi:hypothetical protein